METTQYNHRPYVSEVHRPWVFLNPERSLTAQPMRSNGVRATRTARPVGDTVVTWFVTGCSSGLGLGIAKAALARGDTVAATARDVSRLSEVQALGGDRVLPLRMDLSDEGSMASAVEGCIERFGRIDVLVNNAGHGYRAAIEESEPDSVEDVFRSNFFGPMDLTRMVLPHMRERGSGTIVNVSSVGAVRGAIGNGYYSAAKGALELASEALCKEVSQLGIRVMVVEPGAFRTGFYGDRLDGSDRHIADYDRLGDLYRKSESTDSRDQPGDPDAGGTVIVDMVMREHPPFRLLLGSDAVRVAEDILTRRLEEVRTWAPISARTDFGS